MANEIEDIYTLLVDCRDSKGLIYKVSGVLYENNINVVRNDEYVSGDDSYFFMRSEMLGFVDVEKVERELREVMPEGARIRLRKRARKKLVILSTKEHHCLSELITRTYFNDLNAEILAVISNYDTLRPLTEKYTIPYHYISHEGIDRKDHEERILEVVKTYEPDYLVLAKYMRILTPEFVVGYENKIINIHHSFLPAFVGANPYRQAYERGVKIIGATAHFVNNALDEGPIIAQSVIRVDHKQDATAMALAGRDVEKMVLSNGLKAVLDDKVFVHGNKTIVFD